MAITSALNDVVNIEGKIILCDPVTVTLSNESVKSNILVGFRGFSKSALIVEGRATVDTSCLSDQYPVRFRIHHPVAVIGACDMLRIGLVEEGVQWILPDDDESHFINHHDEPTSERWLCPARVSAEHFARRRADSRWLLTTSYLAALRASHGNAVAIDFCYAYLLGRLSDPAGALVFEEFLVKGGSMPQVARQIMDSSEYVERTRRGDDPPDPARALSAWI